MFVRQAVKIDTSMTVCAYIRVTVFKRQKNQRRKKVIDPAAFCSTRERPVQLPWRYQLGHEAPLGLSSNRDLEHWVTRPYTVYLECSLLLSRRDTLLVQVKTLRTGYLS